MKSIGIITAMKEEADIIAEKYNLEIVSQDRNITFYRGEHNGSKLVLGLFGIGKIQASIGTSTMINKFNPDYFINIGIAGNGDIENVKIGDVVVCSSVIQHDIYLPFPGEHLNYAKKEIILSNAGFGEKERSFSLVENGICATGDQFIADPEKIESLHNEYNSSCVEMEAFAVCSTIREFSGNTMHISVIKGISDGADNSAVSDHMSNLELAMNNSVEILDEVINNI